MGPPCRTHGCQSRHISYHPGQSGRCPLCTRQCGISCHNRCFPRWGSPLASGGMAVGELLCDGKGRGTEAGLGVLSLPCHPMGMGAGGWQQGSCWCVLCARACRLWTRRGECSRPGPFSPKAAPGSLVSFKPRLGKERGKAQGPGSSPLCLVASPCPRTQFPPPCVGWLGRMLCLHWLLGDDTIRLLVQGPEAMPQGACHAECP